MNINHIKLLKLINVPMCSYLYYLQACMNVVTLLNQYEVLAHSLVDPEWQLALPDTNF